MNKIIISICIAIGISGCGNKDMFDTNYTFNRALVRWPDGSMKSVEIKQWRDYDNGEQIQVIGKDGKIYLINSVNAILVRD